MRRLFVVALIAAGLYFAWTRFAPAKISPLGNTTPAANASERIDRLSGAAPQ
jgi:hypothetical protein